MLRNTLFRPYVQLVSKRLDHCRRSEANFGSHTPHRTVRHRHISATPPWLPYLSLHLIPHKIGSQQCTSGSAGGSQGRAGSQRSDLSSSETFHLQHFFSFFLVNCGCKRNHLRCLQFHTTAFLYSNEFSCFCCPLQPASGPGVKNDICGALCKFVSAMRSKLDSVILTLCHSSNFRCRRYAPLHLSGGERVCCCVVAAEAADVCALGGAVHHDVV